MLIAIAIIFAIFGFASLFRTKKANEFSTEDLKKELEVRRANTFVELEFLNSDRTEKPVLSPGNIDMFFLLDEDIIKELNSRRQKLVEKAATLAPQNEV